MIEVTVQSSWHGMVGIRDKYVKQAMDTGQGLLITYGLGTMRIPAEEVHRWAARSERPFKDRYSRELHYLIYYPWEANTEQGVLIHGDAE